MKKWMHSTLCLILSAVMLIGSASFMAAATSAEAVQSQPATDVEYYGRAALAELENATALLYAYDQIVAGVESDKERITVYNGEDALYIEDLQVVWDAYSRDHAEHFWVYAGVDRNGDGEGDGIPYTYYSDGRIAQIIPPYLITGDALTEAKVAFSQAADAILAGITENMSEYEKELYLHDKLAAHITYVDGTYAHTAYGALVEGKAVCDGYSNALQYLLRRAGIQSFLMLGESADPSSGSVVGHAWNLIRIDGEYYQTDLTWDDQESATYHAYFNQTGAVMEEDHLIDATAYVLPECTATAAQYFTGTDAYLDTYTIETMRELMGAGDLAVQVYIPGDVAAFRQWIGDNILQIAMDVGVQDGFSWTTAQCGRELHLKILLGFKVTDSTQVRYFASFPNALAASNNNSTVGLLADCSGDITIGKDICLDLNGFDIDGSVQATAAVTVIDSETDDYSVLNGDGYGRITGTVSGAQPAEGYLMLRENDGLSFHRINVALESVGVRASVAGLYYTGTYAYDEVVARNLLACGVTLSTQNAEPIVDAEDTTCLYTKSPKTLLTDIMIATESNAVNRSNARKLVYGRAYLMLNDGSCIYGQTSATTLQTVVEAIDRCVFDTLTEVQKDWLVEMYHTYSGVMGNWNIGNLKAYL